MQPPSGAPSRRSIPSIIYLALAGSKMEKRCPRSRPPCRPRRFCDRQYEDDGNLASRKIAGTVLKDEAAVTAQVLRMVLDGEVVSRHGKVIKHKVDSLCVHGDEPTAVKVALAVRAAMEKARVRIVALPEMPLSSVVPRRPAGGEPRERSRRNSWPSRTSASSFDVRPTSSGASNPPLPLPG
jgi:hypothetical protein